MGIDLQQGPRGGSFLVSEVPVYRAHEKMTPPLGPP
jgi:hypothetical protein